MKALIRKLKLFFSCLLVLTLVLCYALFTQRIARDSSIIVGGKSNAEQYLLAEMCAQLLEEHTDLKIVRRFNLEGTSICFASLRSGGIDIYFEYTGTAFLEILKGKPPPPDDIYSHLKKVFLDQFGVVWLDRLGYSNHYVLITRPGSGLSCISDVADQSSCRFAADPEVAIRMEMDQLRAAYPRDGGWEPMLMDQTLLYLSLLHGGVDVIVGSVTDGRLADPRFTTLEDDKKCFLRYEVAPMVTEKCLKAHPEVGKTLALLSGAIDREMITHLNKLAEYDGMEIPEVAATFLCERGLISSPQAERVSSQSL